MHERPTREVPGQRSERRTSETACARRFYVRRFAAAAAKCYLCGMETKKRILFVCLGNICRSPAAEGILRSMAAEEGLSERLGIDSAGTYGGHRGDLPDPRMRSAAARRGYSLTHRARQVCEEDFERFDLIVTMDDMNYETLHRLAPSREAARRIFRMTEFCRRHPDRTYVPDPYYEGREGFELVLDMLEDGCRGILEYLEQSEKA